MKLTSRYDPMRMETIYEVHIPDFEMIDLSQNSDFMAMLHGTEGSFTNALQRTANLVRVIESLELEQKQKGIDQTKYTICHCHLPQVHGHEPDCPEYNQDGSPK